VVLGSGVVPSTKMTESSSVAKRDQNVEHVDEARHSWQTEVGVPVGIPPNTVLNVDPEMPAELLRDRPTAAAALLRLAVTGGADTTLAASLRFSLDQCDDVVTSDRQLASFHFRSRTAGDTTTDVLVARHFDGMLLPTIGENVLQNWTVAATKPVAVSLATEPAMDAFLLRVHARHALAVPLFVEHQPAGSLQLFRQGDPCFTRDDAQLLWVMSQLVEAQTSWAAVMDHWRHYALTDSITGLRTRRFFEEELDRELKRSLRRGISSALMMLDLDEFKAINDQFGHHTGDEILRRFARVLIRDMRAIDTVARIGGDEFAVILPETDTAGARFVAARIRDAVRSADFPVEMRAVPLRLRVSIGVALCPQDATQPRKLLEAADLALYQSKRDGRNRYSFSNELRRLG